MKTTDNNKENVKKISFDKSNSLALKGIAILMMLMHHSFLSKSRYEGFKVSFEPLDAQHIISISVFMKICVPVFAFSSGYGLYLNYKKKKTSPGAWTASRALKTMSGFYIIWIISAIWGQIGFDSVNEKFFEKQNVYKAITDMVINFLGLSKLLGTHTLNNTWWYMSAALVFVIMVPFFMKAEEYLPVVFFVVCALPRMFLVKYSGSTEVMQFMPAFVFGMCVAKYDLLNRWFGMYNTGKNKIIKFVVEFLLVVLSYKLYISLAGNTYAEIKWVVVPAIVIAFCCEFINPIPKVKEVLMFLGKHSMNIFMVHTFIRLYYYRDFTYSFGHFALIILVLLLTSLGVSIVLEFIKKRIHYDEFFAKICKRIEARGQQ